MYKNAHLLGVPQEIRNRIYDAIREDIHSQVYPVSQHPCTGYEGLWQACHQLHDEVPTILGDFMVPHLQIHSFLNKPIQSHSIWNNFKSFYVEIPQTSDPEIFHRFAHALKQVAHELQDLRIFGIGFDAHGVFTSSQTRACGKFDNSLFPSGRSLAVSGQQWKHRLPLVNAIQYLVNLRTLVLDNLNMPLLMGHVLKNKPFLESILVATDHRSTLHQDYRCDADAKRMIGSLLWPVKEPLQVKELHLTLNGVFHPRNVIAAMPYTLEKLAIIVPDQTRQSSCQVQKDWTVEMAEIIRSLGRAARLHTLKICIHRAVHENGYEFGGALIGAFNMDLNRLSSLKVLELHIQAVASWFAQDFFNALPDSLEKLYISDLLLRGDLEWLLKMIQQKTELGHTDDYDQGHHGHQNVMGKRPRHDHIRFGRSMLSFVGYEYDVDPGAQQSIAINSLLKLNARLMDRHRNRHLASLGGRYIPAAKKAASQAEYEQAIIEAKQSCLEAPMFDEVPEQHVFPVEDDYFGNEEAAMDVFYREAVAKAEDIADTLTYPVVVEVPDDFKHSNHWMSEV